MTDDRSLERAARSWLEAGPDQAPDHAVEAALLRIQTTNQERDWHVPWRTRPMTQTTRLLAGAAAIAVVLVAGVLVLRPGLNTGIGGPSPSTIAPSASAAPSGSAVAIASRSPLVLDKTVTSERYGYIVSYPAAWTVTQSSVPWTTGSTNTWGSGINDELKGADIRFSGAAQPLATGQTADQWIAAYAGGTDPSQWPTVTIGGQPGKIDYDGGPANGGTIAPGGVMFDAVVVAGGIAYNFNMDGTVDRATFDAVLASVKLPVLPALDQTYNSTIAGFTVQYPKGWSVTPATKAWKTGYDASDPALTDKIGSNPSFAGTSTKLPAGTTFETWYAAYDAARASGTCSLAAREEPLTVDGATGRLDLHCPAFYLEAVVPSGGRAYVLTMYGPVGRTEFQAFLDTVKLTPASAKN